MAQGQLENMYLVNAPAGSGKTTEIRRRVREQLISQPKDQILCITYTKRAAEELRREIESDQVWIGTIHSYLNELVSPYFKDAKIVDLYMQCYGSMIQAYYETAMEEGESGEKRKESVRKYKEKKDIAQDQELTLELIKSHLSEIAYGESSNTMLLYGRLSHDDLIDFSYEMIEKYPAICKRISGRFRTIYIDEYQDTAARVLKIFYKAVLGTETKLYLFGDKMQQIYDNYDGGFEEEMKLFRRDEKLETNYRSTNEIVSILNKIYHDPDFEQKIPEDHKDWKGDHRPQIVITSDMKRTMEEQGKVSGVLTLFLMNKARFERIGAGNFYSAYGKVGRYKHMRGSNTVTEILLNMEEDNPDLLFRMLLLINMLLEIFTGMHYGQVITLLKKQRSVFRGKTLNLLVHDDKKRIKDALEKLKDRFESEITIEEFLEYLSKEELIEEQYLNEVMNDEPYLYAKDVPLCEFRNLYQYLKNQNVSTQHGVKGESHDSVLFVSEESSNPNVRMYQFYRLFCTCDFSLTEFDDFYYKYERIVKKIMELPGSDKMDKTFYTTYKTEIDESMNEMFDEFVNNLFFQNLCKQEYEDFRNHCRIKDLQKCFGKNLKKVYGTLQAYRIFYVGCSRARRNLVIVVEQSKILDFIEEFKEKFIAIGFEVIDCSE